MEFDHGLHAMSNVSCSCYFPRFQLKVSIKPEEKSNAYYVNVVKYHY